MRHNFQNSKRLISAMLVLIMALSTAMPIFAAPSAVGAMDRAEEFVSVEETEEAELSATTPSTITEAQAVENINRLVSKLNGKYFTTTQGADSDSSCNTCWNYKVMTTTWFSNLFGYTVNVNLLPKQYTPGGKAYSSGSGYSCYGFASFAQWFVFSSKITDDVVGTLHKSGLTFNYNNVSKYAKPGDIIRVASTGADNDGHSMIYISCDSSGITVLDSNYSGTCKVVKHKIGWSDNSYWKVMSITRAENYQVNENASNTPSTSKYNPTLALEYAAAHWNDGNGLCAEFVSNCIKAGGLDAWSTSCTTLVGQLKDRGYATEYKLTLAGNGLVKYSDNASILSPGDLVFAYCPSETDGKPYVHTWIYYGNDSDGYIKGYAHNSASNGNIGYNWTCQSTCSNAKITDLRVFHMNTSATPSTPIYETITEGEYAISCKVASFRYLTANNDTNGGQVEAKPFENIATQKFDILKADVGYKIVSKNSSSGRVVNVHTSGVSSSGIKVTLYEVTNHPTQKWNFEKNGEWYIIRPSDNSSLALTCMDNGGVQVCTYTGDDTQLWSLISQNVEPETYTITYDANGGTGVPTSQTKTHDVDLTLTTAIPTRTDYNFKGWNTKADGTGASYASGAKYTSNSAVTLYAVWEKKIYNVTGVTLNKTTAEMTVGDTLTLTATVSPTNATNKAVTWSSNNTNVATVEDGTVTAVSAGTATITVTTTDGGKTAICVVTVSAKSEPKPPVEADAVFTLGKVAGRPGDTVKVPLILDNDKDINSIAVKNIGYDTNNLEFVGFEKNEEFMADALFGTFDEDKMAIAIGWMSAGAYNGELCEIVFKIKDTTPEGIYDITAESVVKNSSLEIISGVNDGAVTVTLQKKGDIDGNDSLDIDDAILLFQHSMMPEVYEVDYTGSMDFDGNGSLDIDDAILLFQHSMMPEIYPLG